MTETGTLVALDYSDISENAPVYFVRTNNTSIAREALREYVAYLLDRDKDDIPTTVVKTNVDADHHPGLEIELK